MQKSLALLICAASVLSATCGAANAGDNEAPAPAASTSSPPDFESLRIKGIYLALPGAQDTTGPDFAGIRSSLGSLGIGYMGYSNNTFFNNLLSGERSTFGQQVYNGQKPTFV